MYSSRVPFNYWGNLGSLPKHHLRQELKTKEGDPGGAVFPRETAGNPYRVGFYAQGRQNGVLASGGCNCRGGAGGEYAAAIEEFPQDCFQDPCGGFC